jgi:hypothetical protein
MTAERKKKILENAGNGVSGNKENVQIELLLEILEVLEELKTKKK